MNQEDFQHSIHPPAQPTFAERRKDDSILLHIKELQASHKELSAKMNYHHAIFEERVEKAVEKVFERSFPDGDPEGHRQHHELVIKREEERVQFWHTMKVKLTEWGLIGFAGWAFFALWAAFLKGPTK